jgi:hypothetical protein
LCASPLLGLLLLAGLAGCGQKGPEIASVEGTVTMDGKPLPKASVVFIPEAGGRPAGSWTDEEGHYVLNFGSGRKGAIPGKNKVMITTRSDPSTDEEGQLVPGTPETVPMKYNTMSTLTFTVEDGKKNVADFQLESAGAIQTNSEN